MTKENKKVENKYKKIKVKHETLSSKCEELCLITRLHNNYWKDNFNSNSYKESLIDSKDVKKELDIVLDDNI